MGWGGVGGGGASCFRLNQLKLKSGEVWGRRGKLGSEEGGEEVEEGGLFYNLLHLGHWLFGFQAAT